MSFSELGLKDSLCHAVARLGYSHPTPVQAAAIPVVLSGRDLLACAQTGTGKTAAFGLPMIQRLATQGPRGAASRPRGLVLVPTRELAAQVHSALNTFGVPLHLRSAAIFGGVSMGPQFRALRGAAIVVATPGRLLDHLQRRSIDLSGVEMLVLDEADRMLDMGFLPPLRSLIPLLPKEHQTLLFSATLSPEIQRLAGEFTRDPQRIDVSPEQIVAPTVTHQIHHVTREQKRALLLHVLKQPAAGQALVFCQTKHGTDKVARYLEQSGLSVAVIHGNKSQNARTRSLDDFKAGRVSILAATDIAARGLDIKELPLVVNYDLPLVAEAYVHRVGRTGRAGLAGRAVSLVSADDRSLLQDIQRLLKEPLEHVRVEGFEAPHVAVPSNAPRSPRPPHRTFRPRGHAPQRRFGAPRSSSRPRAASYR